MNLEGREQALLALVDAYREEQCRTLVDTARREAAALIGRVYQQERTRLHQRVLAERTRARERIQAARAESDTRQRTGGERLNAHILGVAWPRIQVALEARWRDPRSRRAWVQGAIAQARALLPSGVWTLRHAPDWPAAEWGGLGAALAGELGTEPRFVADGALSAGLVIEGPGAMLDASLEGLLKDRTRIEARLLALLQEVPKR